MSSRPQCLQPQNIFKTSFSVKINPQLLYVSEHIPYVSHLLYVSEFVFVMFWVGIHVTCPILKVAKYCEMSHASIVVLIMCLFTFFIFLKILCGKSFSFSFQRIFYNYYNKAHDKRGIIDHNDIKVITYIL